MPQSLTNEFIASGDDSKLRPWLNGVEEHDDPMATIILFKDSQNSTNLETKTIDYFNDLGQVVNDLISESTLYGASQEAETTGGKIPILQLDGKNDYYGVFNNFSLLSFTEGHDQIVKIHMNFGATWNAFFCGNTPNIYQFKGYFIDSVDYPYYQEFMVAYEKYLAGRKAVESKIQTKLVVAGQIIDGYLLNITVSHNAGTTALKEFQFTMLVKGLSWIRTNLVWTRDSRSGQNRYGRQYNGLSNLQRLNQQSLSGLIDVKNSLDNSGKTQ